jgi:hypothetical protein
MVSSKGGISLERIERMTWDQLSTWHDEAKEHNRRAYK